jgi:hypothetical protein
MTVTNILIIEAAIFAIEVSAGGIEDVTKMIAKLICSD